MTLRSGHGDCAGSMRIEVLPADEQPRGIPAEPLRGATHEPVMLGVESFDPVPSTPPGGGSLARGPNAARRPKPKTKFAKGNPLAREGGKARARVAALLKANGAPLTGDFAPFRREGEKLTRARIEELARDCGAGECGVGASSAAQSFGVQKAIESYALSMAAKADDETKTIEWLKLAISAGNASKQLNLTAHELCVRTAQQRRASTPRKSLEEELNTP